MKHFSEAAWSDFARNLVTEGMRVEMQKHIDGGCGRCGTTASMWQSLFAVGQTEVAFMPPEDTVRIVKTQFAPPPQVSPGFRMIFDSALQPVTAGVRGSVAATQFLFESDDYFIDLRVEPRRETEQGCLVGQVIRRAGKERKVHGLQVRLKAGDSVLAESLTNELGEFQLEFSTAVQPYLVITQDKAAEITLPLYGIGCKSFKERHLDRWF